MTIVVFLAFELGYWFHHYLSHRIPFMWEFHKVHHTAEVLTPVTIFRVHPLDTVVYYNILAHQHGRRQRRRCATRSAKPFTSSRSPTRTCCW